MVDAEVAALVCADFSTEHTGHHHVDTLEIARVNVGMAAGKFADESAYHIAQVLAALHVGQQGGIFVVHLVPVHSVHILEVETVAIGTPRLIVDLLPLLGIVDVHCEIVEIHKLFGRSLVGREIHHVELATRCEECRLFAIGSHSEATVAKRLILLLVEVEH